MDTERISKLSVRCFPKEAEQNESLTQSLTHSLIKYERQAGGSPKASLPGEKSDNDLNREWKREMLISFRNIKLSSSVGEILAMFCH